MRTSHCSRVSWTSHTSGILSNEGVVLAAERRNTNKLLDEVQSLSVKTWDILIPPSCTDFLLSQGFPFWEDLQAERRHGENFNNLVTDWWLIPYHAVIQWYWYWKVLAVDMYLSFGSSILWVDLLNLNVLPGLQCGRDHQRCQPFDKWTQVWAISILCGNK